MNPNIITNILYTTSAQCVSIFYFFNTALISDGFDVDKKMHCGHLKECCQDVRPDFQPIARAMLASLTFETWSYERL